MLSALPDEDALFYADASGVVCWNGKCSQIFAGIEKRYRFLGGE